MAELGFDQLELIHTATENITFTLPSGLGPPRRATAPASADDIAAGDVVP